MRTNIDVFKRQMQYIADNGITTLLFSELDDKENLAFKGPKVVISFDDGWLSNYSEIFGFMRLLGLKYNIFLTVGEIGKNPEYMDWDQARVMRDSGLVGLGVHTYTHPHIGDMTGIDPVLEFDCANDVFRRELGYDPMDFCYPFGSCSQESHDYLVKHTHYKRIYTSTMMYSYQQNDRIIFGRNGISNDESFGVYKAKLKGYFNVWKILVG